MTWPLEGSREIDEGIIISEPMDWCKSTCAIVPYRLYAFQRDAMDLAYNVRQTSDPTHVRESIVLRSYGDEPGSGGGVISGTHLAECTPKTWSESVFADGRNVVRHDDEWWMNHKNTWGKLYYVKDTSQFTPSPPQVIDPKMMPADADKFQAFVAAPGVTPPPSSTAPATGAGTAATEGGSAAEGAASVGESWFWKALPWVARVGGTALGAATFYFGSTEPLDGNENEHERQKQYPKLATQPKLAPPKPPPPGARVSGEPCPCNLTVGKYSEIVKRCKSLCGENSQAHHIHGDKHFRLGNYKQAKNPAMRIQAPPGSAPFATYNDGPAICLDGNAKTKNTPHHYAHGNDPLISVLGQNSPVPGTIDFFTLTSLTTAAAIAARQECQEEIEKASENASEGVNPDASLRSTDSLPKTGTPGFDQLSPVSKPIGQ